MFSHFHYQPSIMNAQHLHRVGMWTALAGAVAALLVLASSTKRKLMLHARDKKYDDIFGI
jgi:hypothetical protein